NQSIRHILGDETMIELLRPWRALQALRQGAEDFVQVPARGAVRLAEIIFNAHLPRPEMAHDREAFFIEQLYKSRHPRRYALPNAPVLALFHTAEITEHRGDVIDRVVIVERHGERIGFAAKAFAKHVLQPV